MSLSSLSSCILVNHQTMMGKSLKEVTKKSMPLMVRTWKQLRKSQLCTVESHLFWVVCYLLANSEPEPNQLAAKHLDLYRLGYSISDSFSLDREAHRWSMDEFTWTLKPPLFHYRLMAKHTIRPDCCWELWDLCIQPTVLQPTSQAGWIYPLK